MVCILFLTCHAAYFPKHNIGAAFALSPALYAFSEPLVRAWRARGTLNGCANGCANGSAHR